MKILLTGCAGLIGWKVAEKLLKQGHKVVGVDNLNDYYDPKLKLYRVSLLEKFPNFTFHKIDIEDKNALRALFEKNTFDAVINEAARAGVRYSIQNPHVYFTTNVLGTLNLLELMKEHGTKKFILASTSSLYAGQKMPFREDLPVNTPISPYAASKKSAEVLSYTYHHLYGIDVTVLRYFTVYGPAGRPDMSVFNFVYRALKGIPIEVYGDGSQRRDFTYVDDVALATVKALSLNGYNVINVGNNNPRKLSELIELIEKYTKKPVRVIYKDFHKADMRETWADITRAKELLGWEPKTSLEEGVKKTVDWFLENWDWVRELKLP
ncbi:MAG: NAD-dependent epimerase/dehydratase family protein [Aquificae bacterium]|nr:NAD-dependent epimerase/dehydratase family protein [Aquificota bacterium]